MPLFRFIFFVCLLSTCLSGHAGPTRINVYNFAEKYYDTQTGDTLSGITRQLLPNDPALQLMLADDIVQLNPDAFIDNNPAALRANKRLNLPVYMPEAKSVAAPSKMKPGTIKVESFSWGNIKRPYAQKP